MTRTASALLLATFLTVASKTTPAWSDDSPVLPAAILMATTTGYWEDSAGQQDATSTAATSRHGYYKLYAVRQTDRTSKVYLQRILASDGGPQILSTIELADITALKGYVTDIRPENSGGIIREPGLFATVFIKRDLDGDAEVWNVSRDDLGEVSVEKAPAE